MDRRRLLPAVLAVAVALGAALWYSRSAPAPPPPTLIAAAPPIGGEVGRVTVHVTGLVLRPGLIAVPEGSRVADAVAAAGGVLPGADLQQVNLAALVVDGQHLRVPASGGGGSVPTGSGSGVPLSLNSATPDQLELLPGVGPVLAARIVAHREAHGPFAVVEDLLDVPGIGEAKLAAIREEVLVP